MTRKLPALRYWRWLGLAGVTALLLAACGSTTTQSTSSNQVVTFAEGPAAIPNYISPLESGAYFSVVNEQDFAELLYLPLYWFGSQGQPVFNPSLSIANAPRFSDNDTLVTITLKHWRWSNGQPITSRDVIFWLNVLSAATDPQSPSIGSSSAPGPGWGASVAGGFPQNVVSYQATGTYSLQLKLNASYNPKWYLDNELSQIFPLPTQVWDKASVGAQVGTADASAEARVAAPAKDGLPPNSYIPANPGTASSGALGVAQFINLESQDTGTYETNPMWQVVDGPFKLSQFTSSGFVKFVPNKDYSGSPKPTISAFEEEPFTTDTAEFNSLEAGQLTVGYIPPQDLGQRASLEKKGYDFAPWNDFSITYFPYNFTNPKVGPIFQQTYFRQAYQSLTNQTEYIKDFQGGYGTPSNGPVPSYPVNNPDESPLEKGAQVYPYDPTKAVNLLKDHGWKVVPGGTTTCVDPGTGSGQCGKGIAANQPLDFTLVFASGSVFVANEMDSMQSTMKSAAGIDLTLSEAPFDTIISTVFDGCTFANPCDNWELANWGGGWVFSPDYLPTGEELFETGASSNGGEYSDATNDANIVATTTAPSSAAETKALFQYQDYLAKQLPVVWMPNQPYLLIMYKSDLKGLVPLGVFDEIYPQGYSF